MKRSRALLWRDPHPNSHARPYITSQLSFVKICSGKLSASGSHYHYHFHFHFYSAFHCAPQSLAHVPVLISIHSFTEFHLWGQIFHP